MKQLIQDLQGLGFISQFLRRKDLRGEEMEPKFEVVAPKTFNYFYLCDAQRWLREEKEVFIWLKRYDGFWECVVEGCMSRSIEKTYGEALQKGIEEAVKILKEQNKQ